LRLYPGDGAEVKARHEYQGMRRLFEAGYPVPQVHHLALTGSPLGQPFILMDRIEGGPLGDALLQRPPAEQQALLEYFCELFLQLHRLDWRPFAVQAEQLAVAGPLAWVDDVLAEARAFVAQYELPGFAPVVDWLAARRDGAACAQPAVVHRDFHPFNVLLRADGTAAVIDWSSWRVSDPRFDLAWSLVLAQSQAGAGLRDRLLAGYERATGEAVSNLAYFEAYACLRRLAVVTFSLTRGAARLGMRPEAAALMQAQRPALAEVHRLLRERSGLRVPEVERVLDQMPPGRTTSLA
jgi:aminoglycoside phosphotransferase (APT) family kinase protein